MPIKNITDYYRPQRKGKIHLGIMKKSSKGTEYPQEVEYFVLPQELKEHYGEEPRELHVSLSSSRIGNDFDDYLDKVFPQYLKRYRGGKDFGVLVCKGNGDKADCVNEKTGSMEEVDCPCKHLENGNCRRIGILKIRVQEIPSFNTYQITTSSFNSIVNINSFIRDLIEHCAVTKIDPSSVKLVLSRNEQSVQRIDNGAPKSSTHYILGLDLDSRFYKSLDDVKKIGIALPPKDEPQQLPPADESKDELYFPPNGHATDAEKAEIKEAEIEEAIETDDESFQAAKNELSDTLRMYRDFDGKLTEKEEERLDALMTLKDYTKAIDYFKKKINKLQPALGFKEDNEK